MGCVPHFELPVWAMPTLRLIQFLDAIISLITYAVYLSKAPSASHVVLGIAAAATIWVVIAVVQWAWKRREEKKAKRRVAGAAAVIILVLLIDVIFVALFCAVAGITGHAALGHGSCSGKSDSNNKRNDNKSKGHGGCGDLTAVFVLALINIGSFSGSSILNALQSMQRPPSPKTLASNPMNDLNTVLPK